MNVQRDALTIKIDVKDDSIFSKEEIAELANYLEKTDPSLLPFLPSFTKKTDHKAKTPAGYPGHEYTPEEHKIFMIWISKSKNTKSPMRTRWDNSKRSFKLLFEICLILITDGVVIFTIIIISAVLNYVARMLFPINADIFVLLDYSGRIYISLYFALVTFSIINLFVKEIRQPAGKGE